MQCSRQHKGHFVWGARGGSLAASITSSIVSQSLTCSIPKSQLITSALIL